MNKLALTVLFALISSFVAYIVRRVLAAWGGLDPIADRFGAWLKINVTPDQAAWTVALLVGVSLYATALFLVWKTRRVESPSGEAVSNEGWKPASEAIEAFSDEGLLAARRKLTREVKEIAERSHQAEIEIGEIRSRLADDRVPSGPEAERSLSEAQHREVSSRLAYDAAQEELSRIWRALREDIHGKLGSGSLMARGFREPHVGGSPEIVIPPAEWRVLELNDFDSTVLRKASDEVIYSAVMVKRVQ